MGMEVRRIQRLGSSSLVVTLPKEWARRLGLKPGSQVILIDEGNSIRIMPMDHELPKGVYIDISKLEPEIAISVPYCIYISGYDAATVKLPESETIISNIKRKAHSFMGMEIFDTGEGEVKLEVLIDMNKIEFNRLFKNMSMTMAKVIRVLKEAIEGRQENALDELKFLQEDFLRTLYLALRYLSSASLRVTKKTSSTTGLYIAMAANYTGLVVDLLHDFIILSSKIIISNITEEEKQGIIHILDALEKAGSLELRLIANPSAKRTAELIQLLREAKKEIEQQLINIKTPTAALLLGKLHDAVRLLTISSYVLVCKIIFDIYK